MASRNSFLDSPNFRRITTPSQREAVSSRRRSSGFRGGGSSSSPIRRETAAERQQRERQERLRNLQSELSDTGTRLTERETQAILAGEDVSSVRQQISTRQRREGFASLQRDLSRSGTRLTPEESRAIAEGTADPNQIRSQVKQRRGRTFASSRSQSFVTAGSKEIPVSQEFSGKVQEELSSGRLQRAQELERSRDVQRFAEQANLGGASFGDEARVVTPSGESVGFISVEERSSDRVGNATRLVTASGRDVTPRVEQRVGGTSTGRNRRSAAEILTPILGQEEASAVVSFGSGVGQAFTRPGDTASELFGITQAGRTRAITNTQSEFAGQTAGLFLGASAAGQVFRGFSAGAGVVTGFARQGLARAGVSLSPAAAAATSRVAAPVVTAALFTPQAISSTRDVATGRSTVGRELLNVGGSLAIQGAGFAAVRGSVGRDFARGTAIGRGANAAIPTFSRGSLASPSAGLESALTPTVTLRSGASVRAGGVPSTFVMTNRGTTRQFLAAPAGSSRSLRTTDGFVQQTFSLVNPQQEVSFASIQSPGGGFTGRFARVSREIRDVNTGFTQEAAISSLQNRAFAVEVNDANLAARLSGRDIRSPPTISRSELRSELRFLQDFSSGRRVVGSTNVDDLVPVQPSDQFGLEAFGLRNRPRPRTRSVSGSLDSGFSDDFFSSLFNRRGQVNIFSPPSTRFGRQIPRRRSSVRAGASPTRTRGFARSNIIPSINLGLGSAVGSLVRQRSRLTSSLGIGSDQGALSALEPFQDVGGRLGIRPTSGLDIGLRTGTTTDTTQATTQLFQPITFNPNIPRRGTPGTPRPPRQPRRPRRPFDPDIPGFGISGRRTGTPGRIRRDEEFTPSLIANALGIRGTRRSPASTGIDIRPININQLL
jgi:hypothetical protein